MFIKALFLSVFWVHLRAYLYQQVNLVEGASSTLRQNRYTVKVTIPVHFHVTNSIQIYTVIYLSLLINHFSTDLYSIQSVMVN